MKYDNPKQGETTITHDLGFCKVVIKKDAKSIMIRGEGVKLEEHNFPGFHIEVTIGKILITEAPGLEIHSSNVKARDCIINAKKCVIKGRENGYISEG